MSHDLEIFTDGSAAFVSARTHAWHRLGCVVDHAMTAEQVLKAACLDNWNVRKVNLLAVEETAYGPVSMPVPGAFATVRTHPKTGASNVLGVVGSVYTPVQNEHACRMLDAIIDQSGAHFETAGSLKEGRQVFVTMKLPRTIRVAGVDELGLYLAATTSHDGSSRFRITATPVRIVCANTQHAALKAAQAEYSFKHTPKAGGCIAQARVALGVMENYFDQFEKAAERMLNQPLTTGEFERTIATLWPAPTNLDSRAYTNWLTRTTALRYLFNDAPTQRAIAGTRWAGYQAIVEYLDHYTPATGQQQRAHRVLTSPTVAELKEKTHALLVG